MLKQFAQDITESILVEEKEEAIISFAPYENDELRAEGWNSCLKAIKANRDKMLNL